MKIFCIIPARYGSTRAKGKLLRKILDKPLIEWVWKNASKIFSFSDIFIATDSEEIEDSVKKFGGKIIRTSSSHKCGTDRIAEAAKTLNIADEDIIVNIQADEPLVSSSSIKSLISCLRKSKIIDMATLAYPSSKTEEFQDKNTVKVVIDNNGIALYFSRSPIPHLVLVPPILAGGEEKPAFLKHLGIYAYKMDFLQKIARLPVSSLEEKEKLEQLRVLENGYKIKVVISLFDSQSVNTEEDFGIVENLLKMQIPK